MIHIIARPMSTSKEFAVVVDIYGGKNHLTATKEEI